MVSENNHIQNLMEVNCHLLNLLDLLDLLDINKIDE